MKILKLEEITSWPEIREWTPEEEAEALRLARESYTAEDLKRFGEIDNDVKDGVDMGEFLAELEDAQKASE